MPTIRQNVLRMPHYVPGKPIEETKRELGLDHVVKLASNENPLGPSPKAIQAVAEAAKGMHRYPDASGFVIKDALSKRLDIPTSQIALGNGSDELIHFLGLVFLDPDHDRMLMAHPSFVRYVAAGDLAECRVDRVPVDATGHIDLEEMLKAITPETRLAFLPNPNNPTGTIVRHEELLSFLDRVPESCFVILDEAYFEYAEGVEGYPDGADLVKAGRSIAVLRTFSKAYGLAGLRLGYCISSPEVIDAIDRVREPYNTNSIVQSAAVAALEDADHLVRSVKLNREGLNRFSREMKEFGFEPFDSHANFAVVKIDRPGTELHQALLKKGVIVRPGEPLEMPGHLRVSIGLPEEMEMFYSALREVLA